MKRNSKRFNFNHKKNHIHISLQKGFSAWTLTEICTTGNTIINGALVRELFPSKKTKVAKVFPPVDSFASYLMNWQMMQVWLLMVEPTKGHLISKCLFGVFNFLQKMNKNKFHSSRIEFVCLIFGGNVCLKKSFRFCLTFHSLSFRSCVKLARIWTSNRNFFILDKKKPTA